MSAPAVSAPATNGRPYAPIPVFENSPTFKMACRQLETVADHTDIDRGVLERLSKPKRAMVVSIRIRMDDGHTEAFVGYRVQHSLTSGPSKGGLRFHLRLKRRQRLTRRLAERVERIAQVAEVAAE